MRKKVNRQIARVPKHARPAHRWVFDANISCVRLWFQRFVRKELPFLVSPTPLVDGDLELVEPSPRWVDSVLLTTQSLACTGDPAAGLTRGDLLRFLEQYPRGHQRANPSRYHAHGYTFWMRLRTGRPVEMAGTISLRIGDDTNLQFYLGHVGYGVYPPARGLHLAERAARLLLPLARAHGMSEVWITANPDNVASRRTCERLGGELVDIVNLPEIHPLYQRGDRVKCRYRIDLKK